MCEWADEIRYNIDFRQFFIKENIRLLELQ